MADNAEQENSGTEFTITVKTPKEKREIKVKTESKVKELKEKASEQFGSPIAQLCLIFAGKILKDADTLSQHGIKDGMTVHLVIKSANRASSTEPSSTSESTPSTTESSSNSSNPLPRPDVSATPFGLGSLGGLGGIGNIGMGSANFMEMQQRMQREMMQNPDMVRQMMDNPFVQQMMSNPDVMRQLMMANPQMREIMERNPEITHMLNNPELMRQTLDLARNPAMLQELMRTQDRALSNLESIPGGFNALQRMYTDIQEPMINAAQEGFGSNPFSGLVGSDSESNQAGRENRDPLPNPWAPRSTTASTTNSSSTSTTTTSSSSTSNTSTASGPFGMFNTPGMSSLMSQMASNPQLMQNMLQAPYLQSMLDSMAANPELAAQIMGSNPMFAQNPQLRDQFIRNLPQLTEQMRNPSVQSSLSNPRALQAMQQIMQGMQTLQQEEPGLFPGMGLPGSTMSMPPGFGGATTTTTSSESSTASTTSGSGTDTTSSTTTTASTTGSTATTTTPSATGTGSGPTTNPQTPGGFDPFTNMMTQMMTMMSQGNTNQPPEQRFATQLDQLAMMGFVDREANIRALLATFGDVNQAIERLLQR